MSDCVCCNSNTVHYVQIKYFKYQTIYQFVVI